MKYIKKYLRNILHLIYRSISSTINSKSKYTVLGDDKNHYFVGYYDVDPLDSLGENILCHRVSTKYTKFVEPEVGEVGLMSIRENKFTPLAKTHALNWQLGSRVQWLTDDKIIFNDIEDNIQCAKVFNIKTKKFVKTLKRSFWAISPNKKIGASLNFFRISKKRPGYGYPGKNIDKDHEIFTLYSIDKDEIIFGITLESIMERINYSCPDDLDPYLNHVAWSPCSTKVLTIFHVAETKKTARKIYPVVIDYKNNKFELIHDNGYFSHHVWINNDEILAYIKIKNRPCFAVWNALDGWKEVKNSMPLLDGHPVPLENSNKIVVDSYPDRLGRMSLYIGSTDSKKPLKKIAIIINQSGYIGALRCDLHPRVSSNNKFIICDIPEKDERKIMLIEGALNEK